MENNDEEKKVKIIEIMNENKDWTTSNKIKEITGIHNYKIDLLLTQLLIENKIEVDKKPDTTYWRIKP